jgi:hypothetical protein
VLRNASGKCRKNRTGVNRRDWNGNLSSSEHACSLNIHIQSLPVLLSLQINWLQINLNFKCAQKQQYTLTYAYLHMMRFSTWSGAGLYIKRFPCNDIQFSILDRYTSSYRCVSCKAAAHAWADMLRRTRFVALQERCLHQSHGFIILWGSLFR